MTKNFSGMRNSSPDFAIPPFGSANKGVSGFVPSALCLNPRYARSSDTPNNNSGEAGSVRYKRRDISFEGLILEKFASGMNVRSVAQALGSIFEL